MRGFIALGGHCAPIRDFINSSFYDVYDGSYHPFITRNDLYLNKGVFNNLVFISTVLKYILILVNFYKEF